MTQPADQVPEDPSNLPKSAKQLEKEAKKAAKLEKLAQKNEKKSAAPPPSAKEKAEVKKIKINFGHHL